MSGPSQYAGDWEDDDLYAYQSPADRRREANRRPNGCKCDEPDFLEKGCPTCCNCKDFYKDKPPCQVHTAGFLKTEEDAANAIREAAPDLLKACEEAEATFRVVAGTDPDREVATLSQLRAAIAKAKA